MGILISRRAEKWKMQDFKYINIVSEIYPQDVEELRIPIRRTNKCWATEKAMAGQSLSRVGLIKAYLETDGNDDDIKESKYIFRFKHNEISTTGL